MIVCTKLLLRGAPELHFNGWPSPASRQWAAGAVLLLLLRTRSSAHHCNPTMQNPVTWKVHFIPKVFSVMHSMHHNASEECILSSWESWKAHQCTLMLFSMRKLYSQLWDMLRHDFPLYQQTSYSNARSVMQILHCRTRSWFQKVHSEDDFSCRTNKLCFLFKPLFLLTKLKSRHAERTQFEGYSVATDSIALLKASGYPVFKMHLLKVAKVNILCLSCTQNLLQNEQPKCTHYSCALAQ